jgi:hypothetical protein
MRKLGINAKTCTLVDCKRNIRLGTGGNIIEDADGRAIIPKLFAKRTLNVRVKETFVNDRGKVSFRIL